MKLHTVCLLIIASMCALSFAKEVNAICTLDQMKKYAMEACEHLFRNDHGRDRRSTQHNEIRDADHMKFSYKRHYVRRNNYPEGGFLKLDHFHYNRLVDVDVYPRYKAHKLHTILNNAHAEHNGIGRRHGERIKRAHTQYYNNIPYCCLQMCEEDFFC